MNLTRKQALEALLRLEGSMDLVLTTLAKHPWDSNHELVKVSSSHITTALQRYLRGELSNDLIERWANAIEGREDLGFESGQEVSLKEIIWELGNPLLTQDLSPDVAQAMIKRLTT